MKSKLFFQSLAFKIYLFYLNGIECVEGCCLSDVLAEILLILSAFMLSRTDFSSFWVVANIYSVYSVTYIIGKD